MRDIPNSYLYINRKKEVYFKTYKQKKEEANITPYVLSNVPVCFEKGFMVNDLFDLIETYPHLKNVATYFDDFNAERKQFLKEGEKLSTGKVVFSWYPNEKDYSYRVNDTKMDITLHSKDEKGIPTKYGLSFSPIYEYAHLPIDINTTINEQDAKNNVIFSTTNYPSLLHIINGFFYEISFHGGPSKRRETLEEVLESVESLKKDASNEEE